MWIIQFCYNHIYTNKCTHSQNMWEKHTITTHVGPILACMGSKCVVRVCIWLRKCVGGFKLFGWQIRSLNALWYFFFNFATITITITYTLAHKTYKGPTHSMTYSQDVCDPHSLTRHARNTLRGPHSGLLCLVSVYIFMFGGCYKIFVWEMIFTLFNFISTAFFGF